MFEESVIRKIINCWSADQDHPHRGRTKRPLPRLFDVKEIIEITFLASIKREEDQPIHVSIVLASPEEVKDPLHRYRREILRFEKPFPFTPDSIAKLAPAFDPTFSSVVVHRDSARNELCCWGVSYYQPTSHRFNEIPVVVGGGTCCRLDLFTVTVKGPGSLQISRMTSNIGRFVNGDFIPSSPTPLTSRSLGGYLMSSIKQTELWGKYGTVYWHNYRDALEVLLYECSSRGRGATIVILPSDRGQDAEELFTAKYQLSPPSQLSSYIEEVLKSEKDILRGIAYEKALLERIQSLAQLATIDGALMLTNELELVKFGATLKAQEWRGEVKIGPDGFGVMTGEIFLSHKYGTRHNSAIDFAAACKGAVVFVISQDGPVRAFVSGSEGEVFCWADCTASMFV